ASLVRGEKPTGSPPLGSTPRASLVRTKSRAYFGNTDAQFHALVGDGKHGRAEPIQTFRGLACRTTFSARRGTPLYRLKTPSQRVAMVLSALAEGLDPSAAARVFGSRQATITRWLTRAGVHAQLLHEYSHLAISSSRTCNWT